MQRRRANLPQTVVGKAGIAADVEPNVGLAIRTPKTRTALVSQASEPAVSPISKSAGVIYDLQVRRPATRQVWKPAIREI
ncbi:MAG: hypothetical protein ACXWKG_02250 [Limisphaerales bacterium]